MNAGAGQQRRGVDTQRAERQQAGKRLIALRVEIVEQALEAAFAIVAQGDQLIADGFAVQLVDVGEDADESLRFDE